MKKCFHQNKHVFNVKFYLFIYLFIYLKCRVIESGKREIFCLLAHPPNACKILGWVRLNSPGCIGRELDGSRTARTPIWGEGIQVVAQPTVPQCPTLNLSFNSIFPYTFWRCEVCGIAQGLLRPVCIYSLRFIGVPKHGGPERENLGTPSFQPHLGSFFFLFSSSSPSHMAKGLWTPQFAHPSSLHTRTQSCYSASSWTHRCTYQQHWRTKKRPEQGLKTSPRPFRQWFPVSLLLDQV